jgi:hypothetical protein
LSVTLLVTIDTEEEFDWSAPVSPSNVSVSHAAQLPKLQAIFAETGVRPTYVVDYPIATTQSSRDVLAEFHAAGACEIGAHLHPWVNPPIEEAISPRNSYLCNLPLSLQQAKLRRLTEAIEEAFGERPTTFKAGRYGIDFGLVPTLQRLGYTVDTSVIAYTDWTSHGGPSFADFGNRPFPLAPPLFPHDPAHPPLWEVPCTVGFSRRPYPFWAKWHRRLSGERLRTFHPIGILWRTGVLRKNVLSPEGTELDDQIQLLKVLGQETDMVLNVTLHSPSITPGHTPFVRTEAELEMFIERLRETLHFAMSELKAQPMTFREFATKHTESPAR